MNSRCFWWFPAATLVHQHGVSIESSTKVRETFRQTPQKLWACYILVFYNISFSWLLQLDGFQFIFFVAWQWKRSIEKPNWTIHRVRTPFWTKNSRTFQGPILFFKDQYEKEPWVHVFSSSSTTWAIVSWRSFCVCSFRHLRIWFGLN